MNDVFWMLAGSWAIVYEHLTGNFDDMNIIHKFGYASDAVLMMSYFTVIFQLAAIFGIVNLVL